MLRFPMSYYIKYVNTSEYRSRKFPLVFTSKGKINFSLLVFIKHEYDLGGGKNSSIMRVIQVVSDLVAFFEAQPQYHNQWLTNPLSFLLAFFTARLYGTVDLDGNCLIGDLYWRPTKLSSILKMLKAYKKFEGFCNTYFGMPLGGIHDAIITNVKNAFKTDPKHFSLLSHLDHTKVNTSTGFDSYIYTSVNYGEQIKRSSNLFAKYFPPSMLAEFIKKETDINYKAMYILQAFTGLRGSEALHILISDITPSSDGFVDIMFSDCQIYGKTFDHKKNKLIERRQYILENQSYAISSNITDDEDREFLLHQIPRSQIDDPKDKYFIGHKGVTLQTVSHKFGYRLSWSNDNVRLYFCTKILPELLKQKREANHQWLICKNNGCPMTISAYRKHFSRSARKIIGFTLSPHSLRHFAGFYLKNALDVSLEYIKVFLRHASIETTGIYAKPTEDAVRCAIAKRPYTEFKDLTFLELFDE